jgi:hypothetical protein
LVAAWISLISKPRPRGTSTVAEAFLSYYMLFPIGISNLINFVFHVFFGDTAAKFIGWDNSPFRLKWDSRVLASAWQESLLTRQAIK